MFHSKILAFGVDTDVGAFPYLYCHATDAISLRTLKESEEDSWKSENPKDAVIEYLARIILENHLDIHDYKHSIEPIRELINRKGSSKYLHLNSILNCKMKTNEESLQSTLETAPSTTNLYKCVKCGQELTEYDLEVKCQGHDVCVGCRFDYSTSSFLVCNRAYSDREQIHLKNY